MGFYSRGKTSGSTPNTRKSGDFLAKEQVQGVSGWTVMKRKYHG